MIKYIILLLFIFKYIYAKDCCYDGSQIFSSAYCQLFQNNENILLVAIGNSTTSPCPSGYTMVDSNYRIMKDGSFEWYQCKDKVTGYEYYQVGGCRGYEVDSQVLEFSNDHQYFYMSSCIFSNGYPTTYSSVSGQLQVIESTLNQMQQICVQTGGKYFTYYGWKFGNSINCQSSSSSECNCPSNYIQASCL